MHHLEDVVRAIVWIVHFVIPHPRKATTTSSSDLHIA